MALTELITPINVDLRADSPRLDIIKGIEHINVKDEVLTAGLQTSEGDWLVKGASGLAAPGTTPVANTYPVWVGNDQFDGQATNQATIVLGGGFIYRTTKYAAGTYVAGQNLTVKNLGAGEMVPSAAGVNDPILCRVYTAPDAKGIIEIEVLNR